MPEYWYIDLDAERVEVHRLAGGVYPPPQLLRPGGRLASPVLPGLELAVADILGPWD